MRIQVTESHITNGRRHSTVACPIALACQAHGLPVIITSKMITIHGHVETRNGEKFWIRGSYKRTTRKMRKFIATFDAGCIVEPFAFDIPRLPGETI